MLEQSINGTDESIIGDGGENSAQYAPTINTHVVARDVPVGCRPTNGDRVAAPYAEKIQCRPGMTLDAYN